MELQIQDLVSSIRKDGIEAANAEAEATRIAVPSPTFLIDFSVIITSTLIKFYEQ